MFRGKESSNRIKLSQLVQELLKFGVFSSLQLWVYGSGWVYGGGWVVGGAPHTCAHACMVNMIISCKWPPHWGNPWEFPMMSYVHVHAHVWGAPSHHPPPHPPSPDPLGGPWYQSKFNSTWTNQDVSIVWRFEICGDLTTHGRVYSLVGGWVDGWGQVKSLKI